MIKITLKEYYFSVFSCEIGALLLIKLFIDEDDLILKVGLLALALIASYTFILLILRRSKIKENN
ncbi:hypothetical protein DEHALATV1_0081 [Dehalococcoides mccartyi]|uniref:Uncharacterized protein n=1 Tax=Dehalococcoides mccartyi TaxID=61435 RepID=A0AB33HSK4_9CHLR|nr:hypothetical protein IBK_0105 [Dehalococcoides mccartyi IBARAKI]BAZ96709.1 hypothetical protein DEHALATV1_0081 [Dehalococcoides mccartyi]